MKKSITFYIKTVILIFGFLLLLISAGMPITVKQTPDYSSGYVIYKTTSQVTGFQSYIWYGLVLASLIIFAIGYFKNNTVNIVLVFVFTPLFSFGVLVLTFLATFSLSFGGPSPRTEIANGYMISVIGAILVAVASAISVLRKKKKAPAYSNDLLDSI